ncbi:MAG: hypothetical protein VB061_12650 [Christensenella sp.]|nr:hypothetical protein [Christensenella sp.]
MKLKITQRTIQLLGLIEFIIAIFIILAILRGIAGIVLEMRDIKAILLKGIDFSQFLSNAFSLVIGIEFTRMLIKHSADAAIEVLLFAIARQLIIAHPATWEMLVGVVAIAGVFAIRKYLFVDDFHHSERFVFDACLQISRVNSVAHINLPDDGEQTIGVLMEEMLTKKSNEIKTGAHVEFGNILLRIETTKDGSIETVSISKKSET